MSAAVVSQMHSANVLVESQNLFNNQFDSCFRWQELPLCLDGFLPRINSYWLFLALPQLPTASLMAAAAQTIGSLSIFIRAANELID